MKKSIIIFLYITFLSAVVYPQWQNTGGIISTYTVRTLVAANGNIFAGTDPNGVYISTNNGSSWEARSNGLPNNGGLIISLTAAGTNIYAAVWGYGIYVTTNNGNSWSPRPGADSYTRTIASVGSNLFSGGLYSVSMSTNGGSNWIAINNGIPASSLPITSFVSSGSNIYASGYSTTGGIFLTTNSGLNWVAKNNGLFQMSVYSLLSGSGFLLAGVATSPSVFKSVNGADSWDTSGVGLVPNSSVNHMVLYNNTIISATSSGVFYSTNQGDSWNNMSAGLPNQSIAALSVSGGNIFAAVGTVGVWKRAASEVGIINISSAVPEGYSLSQNYPNPFNPVTNIEFSIAKYGHVKLAVYNILGEEAAGIINDNLSAGIYRVDFDASALASGTYFYRLESGNFSQVKKMILIK